MSYATAGMCLFATVALVACGESQNVMGDTDPAEGSSTGADGGLDGAGDGSGDDTNDGAADETGGEPEAAAGRCDYTSPFTQAAECREYTGAAWSPDAIGDACSALQGDSTLDVLCETGGMLGRCIIDEGTEDELRIVSYGDDAGSCAGNQTGCETFGGGTWEPAAICADVDEPSGDPPSSTPFIQPTLECRDALPGEPPGDGPDGQVCTWQLISASTEQGRHFEDYASCDVVYSQRPYYSTPGNDRTDDARMDNEDYVAEADWVRSQIEASACVCCHSDVAPNGASNWSIDAGSGNWLGTFDDSGLAFGAGWIDSSSFGTFAPEDNNGFDRRYGIPSTDPERIKAFFEAELAYRGLQESDFADDAPFGGPLYTQLTYEPEACEDGVGVAADGTVSWSGSRARYVYVLEADAANPTVPPNLDLPGGTMWRLDVPFDEEAIANDGTLRYGEVPANASQRFPADGAPAALEPGEDYYLYVTADVVIPVTRCLFTYPG